MSKLVEDSKSLDGDWIKTYKVGKDQFITRSGQAWTHMMSRCKVGSAFQLKQPSYIGCFTSQKFKSFQEFCNWHVQQVGYGLDGYCLDKDILVEGNKEYNEHNCVLVPRELNSFLALRQRSRGMWPIGVCYHKAKGKFISQININGKLKHLGQFTTPQDAHFTYKAAKEAEARRWYERLSVGEFLVDERVVHRMKTWQLPENLNFKD